MNKVYLANYLSYAESFADYLNAGAAEGYTLHSFAPSPNAGVWVVMVKSETDPGGATVFDFLRACAGPDPDVSNLDWLSALLSTIDGGTYAQDAAEDPQAFATMIVAVRELLSALRAAVGRVSGGAEGAGE